MRVRIKRHGRNAEIGADEDVGPGTTTEEVDIPAGPFALVGGFSGLSTAVAAIFTFWMVTKPDADVERFVDSSGAQVQMLERALQVEDAQGRETSFQLLRALGLLKVTNDARIDSLIARVDSLPRWGAGEAGDDGETSSDTTVGSTGTGSAEKGAASP